MDDLTCTVCGYQCRARNGLVLHMRGHTNTSRACSVDGCESPHLARGLCQKHYQRMKKFGSVELPPPKPREELFWESVDKNVDGDCWHFTGHVAKHGYGYFALGNAGNMLAHRYAYELVVGPVPAGLDLDHLCHSRDLDCPGGACLHRRCVNPAHLEPVSRRENLARGRGGFKPAD